MRSFGTPITSLLQGVATITFFSFLSAITGYFAYQDEDITAGAASYCLTAITGLAINNTIVYLIGEDNTNGE